MQLNSSITFRNGNRNFLNDKHLALYILMAWIMTEMTANKIEINEKDLEENGKDE